MRKAKKLDAIGTKPRTIEPTDGERTDGLGNQIVDSAEYYLQDSRTYVGNCAMWWGKNSQGYTCNLDEAGIYSGKDAGNKRATDVPWPVKHIQEAAIRHVRVDGPAMDRSKYKPGNY